MKLALCLVLLALAGALAWGLWRRWRRRRQLQILNRWECHLHFCGRCRVAVRGRFAGVKPERMARFCCGRGRPLYEAFIALHR